MENKYKLIKRNDHYDLFEKTRFISTTDCEKGTSNKLSKKNCDELFGIVDVEKLTDELKIGTTWKSLEHLVKRGIIIGFNKKAELDKDKLFGVKEVVELCKILLSNPIEKCGKTYQELTDNYIQSLQQPKEIEVTFDPEEKDSDGCLILKKIKDGKEI